jgi:hypothetical protein
MIETWVFFAKMDLVSLFAGKSIDRFQPRREVSLRISHCCQGSDGNFPYTCWTRFRIKVW